MSMLRIGRLLQPTHRLRCLGAIRFHSGINAPQEGPPAHQVPIDPVTLDPTITQPDSLFRKFSQTVNSWSEAIPMEPDLVVDPRIEITGPVSGMMVLLKEVRELTGHPWWLFLFETALVARLIVFPFVKASQLTMGKIMQGQKAAIEDLAVNGVKPTGPLVFTKTIRTFLAGGGSLLPIFRPILIGTPES